MLLQHRFVSAVLAAAAAVALLSGCAARPWLTDDLMAEKDGRYYTTCEDPADERHEKTVWLTPEQAAQHAEGQPCPDGPLRTGEYWQASDADRRRVTVTRPAAPTGPAKAPRSAATTSSRPVTSTPKPATATKPATGATTSKGR